MALTSTNHPLRVDFVPSTAHGRTGRLGMTFAPGKKDLHGQFGVWSRDLAADLARLRDVYGTDVLVWLLENAELELLGIPGLVAAAGELGIEVLRHPIRDGDPP